ncbi:MAG: YcgN family cysteine cluster protein [Alphaproteobacteria bacterium]|nr:YcgN family cysteine cluster protein [Alphaproteobacteria bacterium]
MSGKQPFWKTTALEDMTQQQWESLCDGCGLCCLNKLEDEDTGEVHYTRAACKYLDIGACRCKDYENRTDNVADCVDLTPSRMRRLHWLPETCAYRLVAEERDLAWWHPLVSGDPESVHQAGVSVRGRVVSEEGVEDLEDYLIQWAKPGGPIHRRPRKRYAED